MERNKAFLMNRLMVRTVISPEGCWIWTGRPHHTGHGRIRRARDDLGSEYVHVISYEYYRGPIPTGMHVSQTCKNRLCVRLDHLELVTHKKKKSRSSIPLSVIIPFGYCTRGHKLAGKNIYIRPNGWRVCRTCGAMRARKHYARKKQLKSL